MERKLLGIYLNDHLAGSMAALELARRCRRENEDTPLAARLDELIAEIEEDRDALLRVMGEVDVAPTGWKQGLAWAGEKVARLKLNGRVLGYSDLSRVEELEALQMGVRGKELLWRALSHVAERDARLQRAELQVLEERARAQQETLEKLRLAACELAFEQPRLDEQPRTPEGSEGVARIEPD